MAKLNFSTKMEWLSNLWSILTSQVDIMYFFFILLGCAFPSLHSFALTFSFPFSENDPDVFSFYGQTLGLQDTYYGSSHSAGVSPSPGSMFSQTSTPPFGNPLDATMAPLAQESLSWEPIGDEFSSFIPFDNCSIGSYAQSQYDGQDAESFRSPTSPTFTVFSTTASPLARSPETSLSGSPSPLAGDFDDAASTLADSDEVLDELLKGLERAGDGYYRCRDVESDHHCDFVADRKCMLR